MMRKLPIFCALLCAGVFVSCSTEMDDLQLSAPTEKVESEILMPVSSFR